jgi:TRAP-type C4-dicarboxylate transport system permease small subunit
MGTPFPETGASRSNTQKRQKFLRKGLNVAKPPALESTENGIVAAGVSTLSSGVAKAASLFDSISLAIIFLVMLLITADIIGRAVFNAPLPGTYNIVESLMVFIVFLAMANTERKRQNIRIKFLTNRFPPVAQRILHIFACLAGAFFSGLIVWCTWPAAMESWAIREYMTGQVSLPLYPSKFMVPIGMFLLMIQFLADIMASIFIKSSSN